MESASQRMEALESVIEVQWAQCWGEDTAMVVGSQQLGNTERQRPQVERPEVGAECVRGECKLLECLLSRHVKCFDTLHTNLDNSTTKLSCLTRLRIEECKIRN